VTLGVPAAVYAAVGAAVIEGMPVPLPDTEGAFASDAADEILDLAASADVVACGPGLSVGPGPTSIVRRLLAECPKPLVLDADALNILAAGGSWVSGKHPVIITPHPGEMARLLAAKTEEVQRHRLQTARVAAERFGAVVVLKGARTVIADPGGDSTVVATGNPAMATGGMGDVLTGAVAAFVGQGLAPAMAAAVAAYLHGLAGDLVTEASGPAGILAREVADALPKAFTAVRTGAVDDIVAPLPTA
jgi:NAD(P)H-hydrate epimerase